MSIFDFFKPKASADRDPSDDFWFKDIARPTAAGVQPTESAALQLTPVVAAMKAISETIATLPVSVYERLPSGERKKVEGHPLNEVLNNSPNPLMSGDEWFRFMTRTAALRGNSYSQIVSGRRGAVTQLIPIQRDAVTPVVDGFSIIYEVRQQNGSMLRLRADEVIHLRVGDITRKVLVAEDPLEQNSEAIAAAIAAQDYAARFFRNDATPRGVIEVEGQKFRDEDHRDRFIDKLKRALSGQNQHSNMVLTGGATYKSIGTTNRESQLLELRKFHVQELCRIFGIPPHVAKDLSDATYSNIEHQALEFYKQTILPWVRTWEKLIQRTLISDPNLFVKFNLDSLLRGDITSRYEAFSRAITAGFMTRNEAREKENWNKLEGLDEPVMQGAMVRGDEVNNEQV